MCQISHFSFTLHFISIYVCSSFYGAINSVLFFESTITNRPKIKRNKRSRKKLRSGFKNGWRIKMSGFYIVWQFNRGYTLFPTIIRIACHWFVRFKTEPLNQTESNGEQLSTSSEMFLITREKCLLFGFSLDRISILYIWRTMYMYNTLSLFPTNVNSTIPQIFLHLIESGCERFFPSFDLNAIWLGICEENKIE